MQKEVGLLGGWLAGGAYTVPWAVGKAWVFLPGLAWAEQGAAAASAARSLPLAGMEFGVREMFAQSHIVVKAVIVFHRTYLTPPKAQIFDRLPALKNLDDLLRAMSGKIPAGLAPHERLDQALFEGEMQWTLFNMPLLVLAVHARDGMGRTACDYLAQNRIMAGPEREALRTTLCMVK